MLTILIWIQKRRFHYLEKYLKNNLLYVTTQALMVYLTNYQLISFERASKLITALTGQKVSQGTIVNITKSYITNLKSLKLF